MSISNIKLSLPILILSLAGLIISYILAQQAHFGPVYKEYKEKLSVFSEFSASACGEEKSGINCDAAEQSKYSRVFNVPLTSFGLFYFMLMLLFSIMLLSGNGFFKRILPVFFLYVFAGLLADLTLLYILIFKVKALCPFCLAIYILNFSILLILIIYFKISKKNPFNLKGTILHLKNKNSAVYILFILVIMFLSGFFASGTDHLLERKKVSYVKQREEKIINAAVEEFRSEKAFNINYYGKSVAGDPDAPVTIVEFSDFLCPACKEASSVILSLIDENPGKIKLYYMNFPLDIDCNDCMQQQLHKGACILAKGAICASQQGKFRKYNETVFENRPEKVSEKVMEQIINFSGLDKKIFEGCMINPAADKELIRQINEAKRLNVNKTPVIFINGKMYRNKINKILLEKLISEVIK
jgi:protein-disulfide isomerase/uncharacterized membrane protein